MTADRDRRPPSPVKVEADSDPGLTGAQVRERVAAGLSNDFAAPASRSLANIVRANTLTPFNALLGSLWVVMIIVAPYQDALFGWVILANTGIGIIQEYRASRALARLTLLGEVRPTVVRDGVRSEVRPKDLVRDDVIALSTGDQALVDGVVLSEHHLQMDESLLTGEADSVLKRTGVPVMSGSFVVSGSGTMRATEVGDSSYAARIITEGRRYQLADSELRDSIMRFIRYVTWMIIPVAMLLMASQLRNGQSVPDAIRSSIAGVITMIPDGLVLLTSIAMAVAVIRLARRRALVQELPAVEALARTDVVCVDKTGTLTDAGMVLRTLLPIRSGVDLQPAREALGALAAVDPHPNRTMDAIRRACSDPGWTVTTDVPFSSERKWSGASFSDGSHWVVGAPDVLAPDWRRADWGRAAVREADVGARILLVARARSAPTLGEELPEIDPAAVVVIDQRLRSDASDTVRFFTDQEVQVKVISGDDATSAAAIAARAGVPGSHRCVDAGTLPPTAVQMAPVVERESVFGRVRPEQKKHMVEALQHSGHTVTMTGDGVNDVLALKKADLGIAMGAGAPATRAVAQIVLLDNKWSTLPHIVFEGRRVLGNIERVSDVFVTKSIYATVIALSTGVFSVAFPFLPRHLTLVGALTIGIPGFFLALMPNDERFRPGFFKRVLQFAVPAGVIAATAAFSSFLLSSAITEQDSARTNATITLFIVAMAVLGESARPLDPLRLGVLVLMGIAFVLVLLVPTLSDFFAMTVRPDTGAVTALAVGALGAIVVLAITPLVDRWRRSD